MRSTYFYTRIQQPVLIRRNNYCNANRSVYYYEDISIKMIIRIIADHCDWAVSKIKSDLFCQYLRWVKFSSIIPSLTIDRLKIYVPQIIESTLNFPAIGIYWFLEEISFNLNHSGNSYIFKTKISRYCFHSKYCLLSLLSIYS